MRRAWPLRHRLLAALLGLCAVGLAAFATASVLLLDHSLQAKMDAQLTEAATTFGRRPLPPPPPPPDRGGPVELPTQYRIAFYSPAGALLRDLPSGTAGGPAIPPEVISAAPLAPVTVPATTGAEEWRVLVRRLRDGTRLAVSMSLEPNRATVHQILVIEVAVGGLVLLLLGTLALAVVRLGLRPLTRMERTAEAIAGGDIDRRVGDTDPRTETGRLGRALNVMLERLATALREFERSERRLRRFVADASHELRTPLTSIRGFAELYHHGQGTRDPAAERLLRRIEAEAARMGVLVEDMLLLARMDQEPALEPSTVDLHVLAGDVVHAARARDRERPIRLAVSDEPVFVLGDEHRLHQVIANLVGNAVQHTDPGAEIRVEVGPRAVAGVPAPGVVHAGSGPDPRVRAALIEVRDQGQGIDPEHLPHVFDRFYRADPGRSRDSGGTGLGLAIAAALVQAHGGRIEVTSTPGHGTAFRVLLPLEQPQDG
ncbi:sensor histidine kinase [Nonomuraea phyllanthi]|uniref:sensor histidine kinase n=1 Tax=Nonomuraea phyllanthi TaxID=2219224 RepID=UPI00186B4E1F|nr:HAMP domain-containing sensor histidine kinase [Nonomuraea phyllanthi]